MTLVIREALANTAYDLYVMRADANAPPAIIGDAEGWRAGEPPGDFIGVRITGHDPNGDVTVALVESFLRGESLGQSTATVSADAPPARDFSSFLTMLDSGGDMIRVSLRDSAMNESASVVVRMIASPVSAGPGEACDPGAGPSGCTTGHRCHDDGGDARPRCVPLSAPVIDGVVASIDENRLLLRVDGRDADADVDRIDCYGVDRFGDRTVGGFWFLETALFGREAFSAVVESTTDWLPLADHLECVVWDEQFQTGVGTVAEFPDLVYRQLGESCDAYGVESVCVTAVGCAPTPGGFVCE